MASTTVAAARSSSPTSKDPLCWQALTMWCQVSSLVSGSQNTRSFNCTLLWPDKQRKNKKDSMHLNVRCKIQTWWGFGVFYNTLIYCFIGDKHYSLKSHKEKIKRQLWKWINKRNPEWMGHVEWMNDFITIIICFDYMHLSETDLVNLVWLLSYNNSAIH